MGMNSQSSSAARECLGEQGQRPRRLEGQGLVCLADGECFALSMAGTRSPGEGLTLGREPLWPPVAGWMGGALLEAAEMVQPRGDASKGKGPHESLGADCCGNSAGKGCEWAQAPLLAFHQPGALSVL